MYMQMGNKTIIWVAVYGLVGYGVYNYFTRKKRYAKIIAGSNNYTGGVTGLLNFGTDFLKSWSEASKNNQPIFFLNGKAYNTKGGKAKTI